MTEHFYLKCGKCGQEATLTSTEELANKHLTRQPSWCRCYSPRHTKLIKGELK